MGYSGRGFKNFYSDIWIEDGGSFQYKFVLDLRNLIPNFNRCLFSHVHREKNIVVYSLTKEAFKHRTSLYWIEEVPDAIIPLVDGDRRWVDPG
ncbi:hypothetical protein PVK06_001796 [Gossypium arboreum]|uniref:RNase H type-1 domain-containing protein n=1 Tax=Gossypium arboreum TaxID=29729 RepID=A0ABR0R3A6_GOSAR|nr:hypothetical protein PVK06_001796 [Gossypium arboreum]